MTKLAQLDLKLDAPRLPRRRPQLPDGWVWSTVREVGLVQLGRQRSPANHSGPHMRPYLRVANVFENRIDISDVMEMNFSPAEYERFALTPGDVLLNEGQSRELVGRPAIFRGEVQGACFQNTLVRFRAHRGVRPEFALLVFRTYLHDGTFRSIARWTTNIAHLGADRLCELDFPLPSESEQARIVEAYDAEETKLDAAIAGLERVQANLKRYRASVLKAAVEGRLVPTEAELARQEGRDYEPASVLLQRILVERRRRWEEAELAKMKAKGKTPRDDSWKEKYPEPVGPETNDLPPIPEGWCWTALGHVADVQGGLQKGKARDGKDQVRPVPYLRVANVQRGYLDLTEVKTILATENEVEKLLLQNGDVLFNEGGDRDKLGRGWVWRCEIDECIHQNHVFRARLITSEVHPEFVSTYGNSSGQRYFFSEGLQTTNLASINKSTLEGLPLPLPPVAEQVRIYETLSAQLSDISAVEDMVTKSITRCTRLRQSILKWAFEGKLVDQDPNDEPASALLARIRAEREATPTASRARKSAPTAKKASKKS